MKMMATAKLRRAMDRLNAARLYLEKLEQIVADLRDVVEDTHIHPLFGAKPVKRQGIILVSGERGLCASFNHDLIKFTMALMKNNPQIEKKLLLIGKKGHEFFKKRNFTLLGYHADLLGFFSTEKIRLAARNAVKFYTNDIVDELIIVYTSFVSALERRITVKKLLPLEDIGSDKKTRHHRTQNIQFDPSPEAILNSLIPRYIEGLFTKAIMESSASEQGARMLAMSAATDRADEMIDELTLKFNRTRQAAITKEINEVVAGADALAD